MIGRNPLFRPALLGLGSVALLAVQAAFGDSLLLKDGRLVTGQVRHSDSGYVIQTRAGEQKFSDDEVEHWTHSETADTSDTPAATAPAAGAAGHPAATPSGAVKPLAKTSQQKTVAVLVGRGNTALAGGDFKAARDSFADALLLDPRNAAAAQGIGYAYLSLSPPNYAKARDAMEIAYAGLQPAPRSVACDLALALAQTRNPMRAAKVLKEYLSTHPTPLDEPALNALAAALFDADDLTRHNSFFSQVGQFYDDYNRKLEATRPGEKRWGTKWVPAAQADQKLKTYLEKLSQIETAKRRMAADQGAYASAAEEADVESRSGQSGRMARINALKSQMTAAQTDFNSAQAELARAEKGFEAPPVDVTLAVVEPEAATAVASAAPLASEPPAGTTDLTAVKPHADPGLEVTGRLFGPDTTPPPPVAPPVAPPGSPAVISARAPEPAPRRKLRIETNAVAFPVGPDLAVTTADAVSHATSITLQIPSADTMNAEVIGTDDASGLALLRVTGRRMAFLPLADAFSTGPVSCISFPEVNLFDPVPAAITGTIVAAGGAKPTANLSRSPRLGGAPLLVNGKVVGVLLSSRDSDQHAIPVATLDELKKLLASTSIPATAPPGFDPKSLTMQLTAIKEKG